MSDPNNFAFMPYLIKAEKHTFMQEGKQKKQSEHTVRYMFICLKDNNAIYYNIWLNLVLSVAFLSWFYANLV